MRYIKKLLLMVMTLCLAFTAAQAQVVVGNEGYDLDYLTPKTYEIGGISYEGADNFDTRVVQLVAGLQVGDRIKIRLTIESERDLDFVQVVDRRAACMEPVRQLSGYRNGAYCSPKDNATHYFYYGISKGIFLLWHFKG